MGEVCWREKKEGNKGSDEEGRMRKGKEKAKEWATVFCSSILSLWFPSVTLLSVSACGFQQISIPYSNSDFFPPSLASNLPSLRGFYR